MPPAPRKSVSKGRRSIRGVGTDAQPASSSSRHADPAAASRRRSVATSSKITLDMAPVVPESITHDYVQTPQAPQDLSVGDHERMVQEFMGFAPVQLMHDMTEKARSLIYPSVKTIEDWARVVASGNEPLEDEVEMGAIALETLIESKVDKAFDRFTAYALRNTFKVPDGLEVVLPGQEGCDFQRAKFVLDLPDGERTLIARLDALRAQVEQARYARHSLAAAEAALDRKLALAAHRRAQVGFVRDALAAAELGHLPDTLAGVTAAMDGIQAHVADIEVAQPSIPADDGWETGRQAYLSWAVGRALAPETGLAAVEGEARALGSTAEVEALGRTASGRA